MEQNLEDKLHLYVINYPKIKLEILPSDVVDILNQKDSKIKELQFRIIQMNKSLDKLDRERV
jgi:hypothetical protein